MGLISLQNQTQRDFFDLSNVCRFSFLLFCSSPLYSIPTTKTDRESSRRLLEMFDRKKNWLFHGMEGSDQDDLSANGEDINEDQRLFLDSYRKSNGIVQDFIRGDGKRNRSKKVSKSDKKKKGTT